MKSIRPRSACPNAVGSSVAIWVAVCTCGPLPALLIVPVKLFSVTSCATSLSKRKLTTSLPPPMSIAPTMREPDSRVSVSALGDKKSAVPPVPMMVPELITSALKLATMPTAPDMVPELFTLAVAAWMPNPPEMVPELVTLAVSAKMPMPPAPAEMVPELVTLAVVLAPMPRPFVPTEIVPELLTLAVSALKMPSPFVPPKRCRSWSRWRWRWRRCRQTHPRWCRHC